MKVAYPQTIKTTHQSAPIRASTRLIISDWQNSAGNFRTSWTTGGRDIFVLRLITSTIHVLILGADVLRAPPSPALGATIGELGLQSAIETVAAETRSIERYVKPKAAHGVASKSFQRV
jgi:hypothetical protein